MILLGISLKIEMISVIHVNKDFKTIIFTRKVDERDCLWREDICVNEITNNIVNISIIYATTRFLRWNLHVRTNNIIIYAIWHYMKGSIIVEN